MEGIGAMNFLALDDIAVTLEGEDVHPDSIVSLPVKDGLPVFPAFERNALDPFLHDINRSGMKWVIIVDEQDEPCVVLNANAFLRDAFFGKAAVNPYSYCHRPILVTNTGTLLGKVLPRLWLHASTEDDDVIDNDLILIWAEEKRVITGSDILGRLLRGIAHRDDGRPK